MLRISAIENVCLADLSIRKEFIFVVGIFSILKSLYLTSRIQSNNVLEDLVTFTQVSNRSKNGQLIN